MSKQYKFETTLERNNAHAMILRGIGTNKRVLEVGCASGSQTKIMVEQLGCRVVGIEIDHEAAQQAAHFCDRVIVGNIESLDLATELAGEKFDVVTVADVLEHLYDPIKTLRMLREHVSDSGYLLASIPNVAHSSVIFEMAQGRFDYSAYGLLDDTHIRFFTRKTAHRAMESAGFIVETMERAIKRRKDTEFNTSPATREDQEFLRYIDERNLESETYQFIFKARPTIGETASQHVIIEAQEQIRRLTDAVESKDRTIRSLESSLEWLGRPLLFRLHAKLKNVLRFSNSSNMKM